MIALISHDKKKLDLALFVRTHLDFFQRVPTVAINLEGQVPQILANTLSERGIFCWAGHYYALEVIEELGLVPDGALRLGLTHYNTEEEVDRILETLLDLS